MDSKIEPNPCSTNLLVTVPHSRSARPAEDIQLEMELNVFTLESVLNKLKIGLYTIRDERRLSIAASMIVAALREMEHATADYKPGVLAKAAFLN